MCLPALPKTPSVEPNHVFFVDPDVSIAAGNGSQSAPWRQLDWPAIDAKLATGHVTVFFSARNAARDENQRAELEIQILRTDQGPSRLILDGRSRANLDDATPRWVPYTGAARAQWRGATTTEEHVKKSRVTLIGFELRDSLSQGVFWEAGDEVVLEDLVITDNRKPPPSLSSTRAAAGSRRTTSPCATTTSSTSPESASTSAAAMGCPGSRTAAC